MTSAFICKYRVSLMLGVDPGSLVPKVTSLKTPGRGNIVPPHIYENVKEITWKKKLFIQI